MCVNVFCLTTGPLARLQRAGRADVRLLLPAPPVQQEALSKKINIYIYIYDVIIALTPPVPRVSSSPSLSSLSLPRAALFMSPLSLCLFLTSPLSLALSLVSCRLSIRTTTVPARHPRRPPIVSSGWPGWISANIPTAELMAMSTRPFATAPTRLLYTVANCVPKGR